MFSSGPLAAADMADPRSKLSRARSERRNGNCLSEELVKRLEFRELGHELDIGSKLYQCRFEVGASHFELAVSDIPHDLFDLKYRRNATQPVEQLTPSLCRRIGFQWRAGIETKHEARKGSEGQSQRVVEPGVSLPGFCKLLVGCKYPRMHFYFEFPPTAGLLMTRFGQRSMALNRQSETASQGLPALCASGHP